MRDGSKGQSFLEGAVILTAATMLVKLIGALFRIPLANILGGVGMSYYTVAYELFTPIYSLTVTGLGVAVSRMVAEQAAHGDRAGVAAVTKAAKGLFFVIGMVGMLVILAAAPWFVRAVDNPAALFAVVAIAPAAWLSCNSAVYRGYFQGGANMYPTAISQVIESVAKLLLGILLAYGINALMLRRYTATGQLLGYTFDNAAAAQMFVLRFAAAGAIGGITLSTACGALYIRSRYRRSDGQYSGRVTHERIVAMRRTLVSIALPIAISTLVVNLSTIIDLASVMNCLRSAVATDSAALLAMYPHGIPDSITLNMIPEYFYGSYTGFACPIFNLIPSLTAAIGVSAIPAVAGAWTRGNRRELGDKVSSILRITMMVAMPAGLGISVLSEPILTFLFPSRAMEVSIVAPILRVMGISAVLVAVATPINSILQAIGRERLPIAILLLGASVKLVTNYTLISRPEINIQGVPYGTLLCYLVIVVLSTAALRLCAGVRVGLLATFAKPMLCAAASSVTAWLVYSNLQLGNTPKLLLAVASAMAIYAVMVLLTGTICRNDLKMLHVSENILKTLEKLGFIE